MRVRRRNPATYSPEEVLPLISNSESFGELRRRVPGNERYSYGLRFGQLINRVQAFGVHAFIGF